MSRSLAKAVRGVQDHQLVGECACGGADTQDHGGLGEDDGRGDGGSVVAIASRALLTRTTNSATL
jgi:hypothetical protein